MRKAWLGLDGAWRSGADCRGLRNLSRSGDHAPDRGENGERGFHRADAGIAEAPRAGPVAEICSKIGDAKLTQEEAAEVVKLARASIQYPASGKLVGDWKVGNTLAHDGAGDRIQGGKLEKRKENGGLCQNCHALAPGEINVGNVGPSLTGYGPQRGNSEAIAKLTYERIYNAWAYSPCSNMPRLGATRHLTPEQITHLVAFLIDPASPVNKR